jgi:hypothetical protein
MIRDASSNGWRDISSAPKDGTTFQTGFGDPSQHMQPGFAAIIDGELQQRSWPHNGRILCMEPTLWRPCRKDTP